MSKTAVLQHQCVASTKKMHGWWPGKRECTSERLLINPYNGCSLDCFFCYANALQWGYFKKYGDEHIVTVFKDYHLEAAKELDRIDIASCGYLSPVTDPFQPIEQDYGLSVKIIEEFIKRNVPVEFITKGVIPEKVFDLIPRQEHSFGQCSVLTPREDLREKMVFKGSATTDQLFSQLKRLSSLTNAAGKNVHTVLRLDPVIPYVTSSRDDLAEVIHLASQAGVSHVIASCLDIPSGIREKVFRNLYRLNPDPAYPYEKLYNETVDGDLNANISFRKQLFSFLRSEAEKAGMSFALCMEYEACEPYTVYTSSGEMKTVKYKGLNGEFMNGTRSCEGINTPLYRRTGEGTYTGHDGKQYRLFAPEASCDGVCLSCCDPKCCIDDLALGKARVKKRDFTYSDYRAWTKERKETDTQSGIEGEQGTLF